MLKLRTIGRCEERKEAIQSLCSMVGDYPKHAVGPWISGHHRVHVQEHPRDCREPQRKLHASPGPPDLIKDCGWQGIFFLIS